MVVASYTHPAYATVMGDTFALTGTTALLSRGLEGEVVSDPRRTAQIDGYVRGARQDDSGRVASVMSTIPSAGFKRVALVTEPANK